MLRATGQRSAAAIRIAHVRMADFLDRAAPILQKVTGRIQPRPAVYGYAPDGSCWPKSAGRCQAGFGPIRPAVIQRSGPSNVLINQRVLAWPS